MLYKDKLKGILNKERWGQVNKQLLAKMISEYMYEDMIQPQVISESDLTAYRLVINQHKSYQFLVKKRYFDSFDVRADSIEIVEDGDVKEAVSAIEFLLDLQQLIAMSPETVSHLIKELNHTLLADAHIAREESPSSDQLIHEDYAWLEGEMTGHPWITYNKGRIGFGYDDYLAYAPEQQQEVKLLWIAVHRRRASFLSVQSLSYEALIDQELSTHEKEQFTSELTKYGVQSEDYYFMPVHVWQWKNVIIQQFAEDIANEYIIPIGEGKDNYLPQQSIRTLVNQSNHMKNHVKLPMSILNTLVYRGLPSERTVIAPQITEFIKGIYEKDSFLKNKCRVILPGEIASINVDHHYYDQVKQAPYQYHEMLGVIFRESIYSYLEEGEQAITLAALLHEDKQGKPFIQSLIENSDLSADKWMDDLFQVVMEPLLHFLYQYGTVFSPHGQNTILVLKDHKPHRLAVKDFVDDVNISDQPFEELYGLTDELKQVLRSEPPEGLTQFIFTGLFICHLRYLASIMDNHQLLSEREFWDKLTRAITDYQNKFPQLEERFKLFDFFKEEFTKLCLNRNRMIDYGYEDGEDRPHASEFGKVTNALAHLSVK
ncbi:IucA/IucC family siderophore biosynthesis protein [Halobacillus shinanisalinarum]|uniref:IucA/IucC family siderophore biosynthesis protein n=1 Tax=Halobacillus shinanisalinarum TaxID=2932258 RepID=A0ABY4H2E5_9BACI|nr:IucA/IucC family siderophore biosynthesis protein [Halobacillus shinanisalinarum]UOQ94305.1 IucA/IucC family siderophore biosynthesis protein [Halobacillus shinanisalinarum]